MWNRLLVPHDFSPCAARAAQVARRLAASHGGSLVLLHVSPLPPELPPGTLVTPPGSITPVRIDELTTAAALEQLEAIAAELRVGGLPVETVAVASASGDLAAEILRLGGELRADALVLGTHGRTGLSHLFLGSIAEKVIRQARVPVVTVRSPAPEAVPTHEERLVEDELAG